MTDLQTDVPQGIQDAIDDFREVRERFAPGGNLAVVQEHKIDVAVRVQLCASITADRRDRQRRKFFSRLLGQIGFCGIPQIFYDHIEDRRPGAANFEAAAAGPVEHF